MLDSPGEQLEVRCPAPSPGHLSQVVLRGSQAGIFTPVILMGSQGKNHNTTASQSLFILPSRVLIKFPDAIVCFFCVRLIYFCSLLGKKRILRVDRKIVLIFGIFWTMRQRGNFTF